MTENDKGTDVEKYVGEIKGGLRPTMKITIMGVIYPNPKRPDFCADIFHLNWSCSTSCAQVRFLYYPWRFPHWQVMPHDRRSFLFWCRSRFKMLLNHKRTEAGFAGFPNYQAFKQRPKKLHKPRVSRNKFQRVWTERENVAWKLKSVRTEGLIAAHLQQQIFSITLLCDPMDASTEVGLLLAVNFTEKSVVRNSRIAGQWGKEEKTIPYFPFTAGDSFKMELLCEHQQIRILLDGRQLCDFTHRIVPMQKLTNLQISGDLKLTKVA